MSRKIAKAILGLSLLSTAALPIKARALSVNCFQSLNFGALIACGSANTVTMTPGGTLSMTGCLVSGPGGAPAPGRCLLTGSLFPVKPMYVSITAATRTVIAGAQSMKVTNFDLNTTGAGRSITVTAFITTVNVGGTLKVGAGQAAGQYSGTYTMNVHF